MTFVSSKTSNRVDCARCGETCDNRGRLEGPEIYLKEYMQNLNLKLLAVVFFLLPLPFLAGCALVAATGAAAGTGVAIAEDRRSAGTMVQDESVELKSNRRIKEKFGRKVHVEVTSFNQDVLLTGEAASATVKNEIEDIVRAVEGGVTSRMKLRSAKSGRLRRAVMTP